MLSFKSGAMMQGRLTMAGTLRLDGWFEGDLVCTRLEVGKGGYLLGNVTAREVIIEGQIVGTITAGFITLLSGAFIEGDVEHHTLAIDRDATLTGRARHAEHMNWPPDLIKLEARAEAERLDAARNPGGHPQTSQFPQFEATPHYRAIRSALA